MRWTIHCTPFRRQLLKNLDFLELFSYFCNIVTNKPNNDSKRDDHEATPTAFLRYGQRCDSLQQ